MAEQVPVKQLQLFEEFPNVEVNTTQGKFKLHDYQGTSWLVLFSHPKCYTPVCTTEQTKVAKLKPEWEKRKTKVVSLVIEKLDKIVEWKKDVEELAQCKVDIPMIEDVDGTLSKQLGMFHPLYDMKVTARTVYILSPDKKIKFIVQYPGSVGRNFDEIIRILDALQLASVEKVATPEGWKVGDKACIVPSLNDDQAKQMYPQGWEAPKPYLRMVDVKKK